jgi:RNA polymerase sigma factor (TIGR02999 family)
MHPGSLDNNDSNHERCMDEQNLSSLFAASAEGDPIARQALFAALYDELRRVAVRELRRSGAELAISPTTLLHEAYLDLSGRAGTAFPDRSRFIAYASRAMRGLVIDFVRERQAQKRGGSFEITRIDTAAEVASTPADDLGRVSDALDELVTSDPELAEVVDLKYFCGFSFREIAAVRGVSERTVQRDWEKARLFLFQSLQVAPPE